MPRAFLRDNGLTIVLAALFLVALAGSDRGGEAQNTFSGGARRRSAGIYGAISEAATSPQPSSRTGRASSCRWRATSMLTAFLFQRGSAKSRDPDGEESPRASRASVRRRLLSLFLLARHRARRSVHCLVRPASRAATGRKWRKRRCMAHPQRSLIAHLGSIGLGSRILPELAIRVPRHGGAERPLESCAQVHRSAESRSRYKKRAMPDRAIGGGRRSLAVGQPLRVEKAPGRPSSGMRLASKRKDRQWPRTRSASGTTRTPRRPPASTPRPFPTARWAPSTARPATTRPARRATC